MTVLTRPGVWVIVPPRFFLKPLLSFFLRNFSAPHPYWENAGRTTSSPPFLRLSPKEAESFFPMAERPNSTERPVAKLHIPPLFPQEAEQCFEKGTRESADGPFFLLDAGIPSPRPVAGVSYDFFQRRPLCGQQGSLPVPAPAYLLVISPEAAKKPRVSPTPTLALKERHFP